MSQFEPFATAAIPGATDPIGAEGLRLRTLVLLRWMAVAGQIVALAVAVRHFDIHLPLMAACVTIAVAVLANIVALFGFSGTRRLTETEAMLTLLLDMIQLGVLLYFTGGINNPFALLILVPVTISATALRVRSTVVLGLCAIGVVTFITLMHSRLHDTSDAIMELPGIFRFGNWLALVIGIVFIGLYTQRVSFERRSMSRALVATQMALAREQKLTDLGGVVAAAAHELGTPLATIKLVSTELLDDLNPGEMRDDISLIRDQADRCRDILHSMGRAGKDDLHIRHAPIEAVLREAAEPHLARGRQIDFAIADSRQPEIVRSPEIIHGLRNLIQNAVDFADERVVIEARWSDAEISVQVSDDGPGYPAQVLSRIGEPFMRRPRSEQERHARPGYEGMGLGLFIAKTLLERSGATLSFANSAPASGARVAIRWQRERLEANRMAAGNNPPMM